MTAPIEAVGLTRMFDNEPAVDGMDVRVGAGEIHALVGLNGAGKTTLLRLLLGMLRPDAGRAIVLGHDAAGAPPDVWRQVGHLIESPFAYPELTVRENLAAAALLHSISGGEVGEAVSRVIDQFMLGHWADRRARVLSQGNRQRLGLASALVHEPSILILDEPANALDPAGVVFIRDLLRRNADNGAAVLVSSHHLDQLARVAHNITVIHRGRLVGNVDP
ncbi:MAG: ATP-binding cassette domain-containing protein, partial [Acidimicrobiia bacterium]|nr:ATP-binding cassette domain-containing protein [Acidimicrobiia bacterium]